LIAFDDFTAKIHVKFVIFQCQAAVKNNSFIILSYNSQEILYRNTVLTLRSSVIDNLHFEYDVDGLAFALPRASDLLFRFDSLEWGRVHHPMKTLMTKHCLEKAKDYGVQLGFSAGYSLHFAHDQPAAAQEYPTILTQTFLSLTPMDFYHRSAKRNTFIDKRLKILANEHQWVYSILDRANSIVSTRFGSPGYFFFTRFGYKDASTNLPDLVKNREDLSISIHIGMDITHEEFDLFWSRGGLQGVVPQSGCFYPVLSLQETGNYVSRLSGRRLPLSSSLKCLFHNSDQIHFLQFYVDTPHMKVPWNNPVSGKYATLRLLHHSTSARLDRQAQEYLDIMTQNSRALCGGVHLRAEFVLHLRQPGELGQGILHPQQLVNEAEVRHFFEQQPMVIPIANFHILEGVQLVANNLCSRLESHLSNSQCTVQQLWAILQVELALEVLFYGHPLRSRNKNISITLGPGTNNPTRSRTSDMEFLALEPPSTAQANEDSLPDLTLWTESDIQVQRITLAWTLICSPPANPGVQGPTLLHVMMKDLMCGIVGTDVATTLTAMKAESVAQLEQSNIVVVGSKSVNVLVEEILKKWKTSYPMVLSPAIRLSHKSLWTMESIISGIHGLQLNFFPSVVYSQPHRRASVSWSGLHMYKLTGTIERRLQEDVSSYTMTKAVLGELADRNLCFDSNIRQWSALEELPWIKDCLRRIKTTGHGRLLSCTFVTCVVMLQKGKYVNYGPLRGLMSEMGQQRPLQECNILSHYELKCVYGYTVFKTHSSLNTRIPQLTKTGPFQKPASSHPDPLPPIDLLLPSVTMETDFERIPMRHDPFTVHNERKWSSCELQILNSLIQTGEKKKYQAYLMMCKARGVPDRSRHAFNSKMFKLSKAKP
jgi:hypothetical protein